MLLQLKIGRECITHYSNLRRFCVFSHDELVCKMALEAERLEATVALATYQDMRAMLNHERKLRKSLLDWVSANKKWITRIPYKISN